MVMCRCLGELDATSIVDGFDEFDGEVAATIAPHRAREPIAREDVLDIDVEDLLASRLSLDRDGLYPPREAVSKHY